MSNEAKIILFSSVLLCFFHNKYIIHVFIENRYKKKINKLKKKGK